jgi:hypothetical protein
VYVLRFTTKIKNGFVYKSRTDLFTNQERIYHENRNESRTQGNTHWQLPADAQLMKQKSQT